MSTSPLHLPPFGFGCASLMGRLGRRRSLDLLRTALDAGYTHFDVARLYGHGEAERVVGEALRARLGDVTVATKIGLSPPAPSRRLAAAKRTARVATRIVPPLRRFARRRADALLPAARFSVSDLRVAFDRSQRELRLDRIDVLLLHEPMPEDLTDEVRDLAQGWVASGRIRAFGVAPVREAWPDLEHQADGVAVLQVADSVCDPPLPTSTARLVTHSAVARAVPALVQHLERSGETARWSDAVGADLSSRDVLASLALAAAGRRNPGATLLTSSRDPARVRANADVLRTGGGDVDLDALAELGRRAACRP